MNLLNETAVERRPVVWTIAGLDASGGGGLQADVLAISSLGAHACPIATAITAQGVAGVTGARAVGARELKNQISALKEGLRPRAIKIGMIPDLETLDTLADQLAGVNAPVIYDPVLRSSSGTELMSAEARARLDEKLFMHVSVLTPNLPEVEMLLGRPILSRTDVEAAAAELLAKGVEAVVIKGGHARDGECADFFLSRAGQGVWLASPRLEKDARGTGCTFASALAAAKAFGFDSLDASVIAKTHLNSRLRTAAGVGDEGGLKVLANPTTVHTSPADLPSLRPQGEVPMSAFLDRGPSPLGFYPIVDRAAWLERLLPQGISTIQLRIKDLHGEALEKELQNSIAIAKRHDCRLFINDHWREAIRFGAYGVHLGQEDLGTADLTAIRAAGVRLGVSTHSYAEMARAKALKPTYIAIGPIFPTTLKSMRFAPQGLARLSAWRRLFDCPVVAIGGITLEKAPEVAASGVESIAVVSDITANKEPESRARAWVEFFRAQSVSREAHPGPRL